MSDRVKIILFIVWLAVMLPFATSPLWMDAPHYPFDY